MLFPMPRPRPCSAAAESPGRTAGAARRPHTDIANDDN